MNSEALTLPNLRGDLRQEVLQRVDQILEDLRTEMSSLRVLNQIGVDSVINKALHSKRKELDAAQELISILNEEYHAGHIDFENEALHSEGVNLECRIESLMGDTLVLRTSGHQISGGMRDDIIWRQGYGSVSTSTPIDKTCIDSLIAPYKTPEGAKLALFAPKDVGAENRFRENVFKAYDAKRGKLAWCVISGQWHDAKHVKVFDIVPHRMGEATAQHILGSPDSEDGHLMGAKNGMPMHRVYAEALRGGNLVLLPEEDQDDEDGSFSRWRTSFWDDNESLDNNGLPWGPELEQRLLQFQNQFRPATRYLYFLYCMTVLRWQRYQPAGWWRTCFDNPLPGERPVGFYLRESTLQKVARIIGHLGEEEAVEFAAERTFRRAPDDSDEDEGIDVGDGEDVDDFHACVSGGAAGLPGLSGLMEDEDEWESVDDEEELCQAVDGLRLPT
ncbi:hypothetical protein GGI43DRAFT_384197 [Trichoderma evansii]